MPECKRFHTDSYVLEDERGGDLFRLDCGFSATRQRRNENGQLELTHNCFFDDGDSLLRWADERKDQFEFRNGMHRIKFSFWHYDGAFKASVEMVFSAVAATSPRAEDFSARASSFLWLTVLCVIGHLVRAKFPPGSEPMKAIYKRVRAIARAR